MDSTRWTSIASVLLIAAGLYAIMGLAFATIFATRGITAVDHAANGSRWTFRLLVIPGAAALWPWLVLRWRRAVRAARPEAHG